MTIICLQKVLFVVFIDHNCLAYHDPHHHDVAMIVMLNYFVIMLRLIVCLLLMLLHKKMNHSVLKNGMVICLQKVLFFIFINRDCLAYCIQCLHDVSVVIVLNYFVIILSLTFCFCMLYYILQVQTRDAGKEKTALAVYWVNDGVNTC